jgi:hypothetical protein
MSKNYLIGIATYLQQSAKLLELLPKHACLQKIFTSGAKKMSQTYAPARTRTARNYGINTALTHKAIIYSVPPCPGPGPGRDRGCIFFYHFKFSAMNNVKYDYPKLLPFWAAEANQYIWDPENKDLYIKPSMFTLCETLDELRTKLGDKHQPAGTGYYYKNLWFCCEYPGWDSWLTYRGKIGIQCLSFLTFIQQGNFENFIEVLLTASEVELICDHIQHVYEDRMAGRRRSPDLPVSAPTTTL